MHLCAVGFLAGRLAGLVPASARAAVKDVRTWTVTGLAAGGTATTTITLAG